MNALIRVKLALTEDTPTIKPYDENAWSTLADMKLPVDVSLSLIDRDPHAVGRCRQRDGGRPVRTRIHPSRAENRDDARPSPAAIAWHSHHHLAHITELRRRERW